MTLTRTIWPMGAELPKPEKLELLWDNPKYIADSKISGERLTLTFANTNVKIATRSASKFAPDTPIDVTHRWPQIQHVRHMLPPGTVLDGEAWDPEKTEEEIAGCFNHRSANPMPDTMKYVVFDCIYWGDESLENYPWSKRRLVVENAAKILNSNLIIPSEYVAENKRAFFERILAQGGEGVVLKHIDAYYYQGKKPANVWVKAKKKETYDCIITGFKPAKPGKFSNLIGSVELSQYTQEGELVYVCHSSGINDQLRNELTVNQDKYIGRIAVVDGYERSGIKIKQPRIKYIRPEGSKNPKECIIENRIYKEENI